MIMKSQMEWCDCHYELSFYAFLICIVLSAVELKDPQGRETVNASEKEHSLF